MSDADELAVPAVVASPARSGPPGGPLGRWLLAHRVFVLVLLGFVATSWIITIRLSAADA